MHILFDIGGTKMRVAILPSGQSDFSPQIVSTPADFSVGYDLLVATIKDLVQTEELTSIVGGIAGPVHDGQLISSPNLSGWVGQPLASMLADEFEVPVKLFNDTALVGLGEAVYGAGGGHRIVAYITISTGVGGVRIIDGQIDQAAIGFEPGHQIIDFEALKQGSNEGRLDEYISGEAMERRFGKPPYEITDDQIWRDTARLLAIGLHNIILHWSPDVVVLGGSMMKTPGIKVEEVEEELKNLMNIFPVLPELRKATLGDLGGLSGGQVIVSEN